VQLPSKVLADRVVTVVEAVGMEEAQKLHHLVVIIMVMKQPAKQTIADGIRRNRHAIKE